MIRGVYSTKKSFYTSLLLWIAVKPFTVNFPLFTEILFVLPKNHITCALIKIRFVLTTAG